MTWKELYKPWHDTTVDYCDVCGTLLIRKYWEFNSGDLLLRACCEGDEKLWKRLEKYRESYPKIIPDTPLNQKSTVGLPTSKV